MSCNERCGFCKKKINILSFTCKFCHSNFCCSHQLPETHKCDIKKSDVFETFRLTNTMNYSEDNKEYQHLDNKGLTRF
jgi:predicted nucleic acid binding AN1-type Zn finger protein